MSYAKAARGFSSPAFHPGPTFHPGLENVNGFSERALGNTTLDSPETQFDPHVAEGCSKDAPNTEKAHVLIEDDLAGAAKVLPKYHQPRKLPATDLSIRKYDLEKKLRDLRSFHDKFVLLTPTLPDLGPDEIGELAKSSLPLVSYSYPVKKKVKVREERIDAPMPPTFKLPGPAPVSKDPFASQLARVSQLTTREELGGNQDLLKGYRGQQLKAYNPHLQPGTESILDSGSSVETLTNNLKSSTSEVIRNRVQLGLRRSVYRGIHRPGWQSRHTAMFYLDWDILSFLQEQYPLGLSQGLDSILTISGQANDAYMSTVRKYLEITWPRNPAALLDALQGAVVNYPQIGTPGSILFSSAKSDIIVNLLEKSLLVTGSEEFVVTVAQQLSWLGAACRVAPLGLGCSYTSFNEVASKLGLPLCTFQISSEVVPLTSNDPGSCWNEVVGNSTIVTGFPIPERINNEKGLELPLEVMAALGGIPLATQFNGGYVLKARSIAFVPVERRGNSIQWHLVKKGGAKLRYKDIGDLCPIRLPVQVLDQDELSSTRAFLGWCSDAMNNLGTNFASYHTIGFSKANTPSKRVVALSGVSVGFGHIGTGQANFTFGKYSGSYTADKPNYYLDVLDDAKQIHVILQDTEHRRAWQTDGERAILNLILNRHAKGAYTIENKAIELVPADSKVSSSVRSAMLQNANFVVTQDYHMEKREVHTKLFKDVVGDLYARLEGLEANAETVELAGIELKLDGRRRIQGYEYMDLVQKKRKMLIKEAELRKTCGQWPEFAREIGAVILFGSNFGEVLQPAQSFKLCPTFRKVPQGKDYLVVETSTLQMLFAEQGSLETQQQLTAAGTQWHRSTHLFEACPPMGGGNIGVCQCERIQEFIPKNAFGRIRAPGRLENSGAVIFGHGSSRWARDIANSWMSLKNSLKREESQLPRQTQASGSTLTKIQKDLSRGSTSSGLAQKTFISLVSVEEGSSTTTSTDLQSLDPQSNASRPIQQSPRILSFQYSEKTGSSTGLSSNRINADLEFMTPAISVPNGSEDGHETYLSSDAKPQIRQDIRKMESGEGEHSPKKVSDPPLPSGSRKHEQIRYTDAARASLSTSVPKAVSMTMNSMSSSLPRVQENGLAY